jgi:Amt family ammonium transporter
MFPMNVAVLLGAGMVVFLMQAGFAVMETGLCRAKNAAHAMSMTLMAGPLCAVAFWAYGFALAWGNFDHSPAAAGWHAAMGPSQDALDRGLGLGRIPGDPGAFEYPLLGGKGFCLRGLSDGNLLAWFFWTMALLTITATVPTGALAERWHWKSFLLYGCWVAVPCALVTNWIWGGGLLAVGGARWGLGRGVVDFAGSGVIHAMGGMMGLAGSMVLGPRIGKYLKRKPVPFPAHQMPMVVLGTLMSAFGWLGLNAGWAVVTSDVVVGLVVVNTVLAGAAGALAAMVSLSARRMKPEPTMLCNGLLAGLAASSASCAFVDPWAALLIGGIAGVLVVASVIFWESHGIDDPVGAVSTHGVGGLWGLLALGLFANGKYGHARNGVVRTGSYPPGSDGVRGLLYGDASQLVAQLLGAVVIVLVGFVLVRVLFTLSQRLVAMRVSGENEYEGLDISEMGARGYPDFTVTSRG